MAELATPPDLPLFPNFNVAPSQNIPVVRSGPAGREAALVRWGLVPFWADDPSIGSKMINARSETIADKPSFRQAFKKRRCLIPANGFFEWQKPVNKGDKKQPFYVRLKTDEPLMFAGLWERWDKGDEPMESCTIITCEANALVAQFHTRMPVIVLPEHYGRWLVSDDAAELQSLLVPLPAARMTAYPVSPRMNSPGFNQPGCIEPIAVVDASMGHDHPPASD